MRTPAVRRKLWVTAAVALAALVGVTVWALTRTGPEYADLSEVVAQAQAGHASSATISPSGPSVEIVTTDGATLRAYYPSGYADTLTSTLLDAKVPTRTSPPPSTTADMLWSLAAGVLPLLLIMGFFMWALRSGALGGGIASMRGGRGDSGQIPDTRFSDIAGADEAIAEMRELVDLLAHPQRYDAVGARPPRGALLVGPPGTGKTLLARAVAGEAGVPFFPIAGSDFVETFVGVGARRVRDLFDAAKDAGVAIIFIDEIDAVGRARTGLEMGGDTERDSTLIAMLNEMDGFTSTRIIVLAATNRPDVLDPALTRPGRLDRQVVVPLPDRRGRERILDVHLRTVAAASDIDVDSLAARTPGFSGADLARVVNDAAIAVARRDGTEVTTSDLADAVSTVALGRARTSAMVSDSDRRITAWHEAGHALAAMLEPHAADPVEASIIPRGAAGGATWMGGTDDMFLSRSAAQAQLVVSLAGRAAEKLALDGDYTSGASSDLAGATRLATAMVTSYGMDGPLAHIDLSGPAGSSEAGADAYRRIGALVDAASDRADLLLGAHVDALASLAGALLEQETLDAAGLRAAAGLGPGTPPTEGRVPR